MSQPTNSNGQYVRRVTLPSGRSIEVVYFEPLAAEAAAAGAGAAPVDDLHVCPECDRDLVYPVDWEEASATHWEVVLRCPNCEWTEVGKFDQATVERFDEELDQRHRGARPRPPPPRAGEHGGRGRRASPPRSTPTRSSPKTSASSV